MKKVKLNRNKKRKISLPGGMIKKLAELTRRGNHNVRVVKRAQILLAVHREIPLTTISSVLNVSSGTIKKIIRDFRAKKKDYCIMDAPRVGRKKKLNQKHKTRIAAIACSDPPKGFSRWSLSLLQEKINLLDNFPPICRESIRIVLESHDLKPWCQKMWCVPTIDREYTERMEDILRLYEQPYRKAYPLVCLDERPIVLHSDVRPFQPMAEGKSARQDSEYKREGTANAFCAVEPQNGKHITKITQNRKAPQFAYMIKDISNKYPKAKKIHLVMDNLNTHCAKSLISTFGDINGKKLWSRFILHYTPKHGSWLNMAEIEISLFSRQCLGKRRIPSIEILTQEAHFWNQKINKRRTKINWTFTRKKARLKFRYIPKG